jgi:hypothetical protein
MFDFLRAIGLHPIDWSEAVKLTGKGSPYIGEILDAAFAAAQAIVVLMTPDEVAYLRPEYANPREREDVEPGAQPRPNVLFEAGMGLGRDPDRTIVVELGKLRPFSDVAGRHVVRMDGGEVKRRELADRLHTAGCDIDLAGEDWKTVGDLRPPPPPPPMRSAERATPVVVTKPPPELVRVDAHHLNRGKGRGMLSLRNTGSVDLHDLRFKLPPEAGTSFHVAAELPIPKLPVGKSVQFHTARTMGPGSTTFDIPITARTPGGVPVETEAFVSLL